MTTIFSRFLPFQRSYLMWKKKRKTYQTTALFFKFFQWNNQMQKKTENNLVKWQKHYFRVFSLKWTDVKTEKSRRKQQRYFLPSDFDIYFWSKLMEDLNSNCKPNRQPDMSSNISKLLQTRHQWIGGLYFDYSFDDPWTQIQATWGM